MGETENRAEDAKGRAKEAVGVLTDNQELEREGKIDRAASSAREAVEAAKDKVDDAIDRVKDTVSDR